MDHDNKSVSISCRFEKRTYDVLNEEAEKNGISINSIINNISKNYAFWDRHANNLNYVYITKIGAIEIFNKLDEKDIKHIAEKVGSSVPRDLLMMIYHKITFDNISKFLEFWSKRFGAVQSNKDGETRRFTIYHEINKNFSEYISYMYKAMARDIGFKFSVSSLSMNSISFTIEEL